MRVKISPNTYKRHISIIDMFKIVHTFHTTTLGCVSFLKRIAEISQLATLVCSLKVDFAEKLSNQVDSSSTIINLVVSRFYLVLGLVH